MKTGQYIVQIDKRFYGPFSERGTAETWGHDRAAEVSKRLGDAVISWDIIALEAA